MVASKTILDRFDIQLITPKIVCVTTKSDHQIDVEDIKDLKAYNLKLTKFNSNKVVF